LIGQRPWRLWNPRRRFTVHGDAAWREVQVSLRPPEGSVLYQKANVQGGAVNRGLKRYISMNRPSCLIEAYVRPVKYWLVWGGPLANHLNNL
jgi:hypothetical protein